jgi:hypothetical protein
MGKVDAIILPSWLWCRVATNKSGDSKAPNTACTRSPAKYAGVMVVGVCAFSSTLRGLRLVPSNWRYLVPSTSG